MIPAHRWVSSAPDYNIVQPYEVLEFFRDMVATQGFNLETAGTLFGGSQFWALARVAEAQLAGWDKVGGFVLINTSADGSKSTEVRDTTVRVVCNNTLSMALAAASKKRVTINHKQRFNAPAVQKQLGISLENFHSFIEAANMLTAVKVSSAAAEKFTLELLRGASVKTADEDAPDPEDAKQRRPRGLDTILSLFAGEGAGACNPGSFETAWGLVNAVTEYVDYHSTAKSESHRLQRAMWGSGDVLKTMALEKALAELV